MKPFVSFCNIIFLSLFFFLVSVLFGTLKSNGINKINSGISVPLELELLSSAINSRYTEYNPFIVGNQIFFQSNRPDGIGVYGDFDIWYAFIGNSTKNILNLGSPINTNDFQGAFAIRLISESYWEIYFTGYTQNKETNIQSADIFYAKKINNIWQQPIPLEVINSDFQDRMPSISSDGKILYFSSNRPGGYGEDDIWASYYNANERHWSYPKNLGKIINTKYSEITPHIHKNNTVLYFSSNQINGYGDYDIYFAEKLEGTVNAFEKS